MCKEKKQSLLPLNDFPTQQVHANRKKLRKLESLIFEYIPQLISSPGHRTVVTFLLSKKEEVTQQQQWNSLLHRIMATVDAPTPNTHGPSLPAPIPTNHGVHQAPTPGVHQVADTVPIPNTHGPIIPTPTSHGVHQAPTPGVHQTTISDVHPAPSPGVHPPSPPDAPPPAALPDLTAMPEQPSKKTGFWSISHWICVISLLIQKITTYLCHLPTPDDPSLSPDTQPTDTW
jgi:hypothetical protein